MMKRALVGFAVAAIALVPAVSHAQRASASQPLHLAMSAGVAMPMDKWADAVGTGFHLEGTGMKKLAASPAFVRGEAAFTMFGSKQYQGSTVKGSGNQIAGIVDLGYNFVTTSTMKPYVLGGLGLHHSTFKITDNGQSASDSKNELGLNVGGGMRFKMGGRVAFLEARYMAAGDVKSLPIGFGVEF